MIDTTIIKERQKLVPLGPWLDLAARAGVPAINATFSEPFPVAQISCYLDSNNPRDYIDILKARQWLDMEMGREEENGNRVLPRWECCMPGDLKYMLSKGQHEWELLRNIQLPVDDPRVIECTVGGEEHQTRICWRDYVKPLVYQGYPVEFRAFVVPDGVISISSYYPQRELPTGVALNHLPYVHYYAMKLYTNGDFPIGFTADFLVSEGEAVLFLEGGPPSSPDGLVSAHPCCFAPGKISGIALKAQEGALSY